MINMDKNQYNMYVLGKSKDLVIKAIESNENAKALILGKENSTEDLRYNNVFDTLIIDLSQNETKTYVTMESFIGNIENKKIKTVELILNVFTHLSTLRLTQSEQLKYYTTGFIGNRVDTLIDIISRDLLYRDIEKKEELNFGASSIEIVDRNPMYYTQPTSSYYGKSLKFYFYDVR